MRSKRTFTVLIEQDEEGYLVATVPALRGCHTQAKNLDTLMKRVREVIALCLEEEKNQPGALELVGIQQVTVGRAFHDLREENWSAPSKARALPWTGPAEVISSSNMWTAGPLPFPSIPAKPLALVCCERFCATWRCLPTSRRTCFKWFVSSVSLFAGILSVLICAQAGEEEGDKIGSTAEVSPPS